jgi:hypothetical protein
MFAFGNCAQQAINNLLKRAGVQRFGQRSGYGRFRASRPVEGIAKPIQQFPSRFIRDAEGKLQLFGAAAAARRGEQNQCLQPLMEWKLRIFEQCVNRNSELTAAGAALPKARP